MQFLSFSQLTIASSIPPPLSQLQTVNSFNDTGHGIFKFKYNIIIGMLVNNSFYVTLIHDDRYISYKLVTCTGVTNQCLLSH